MPAVRVPIDTPMGNAGVVLEGLMPPAPPPVPAIAPSQPAQPPQSTPTPPVRGLEWPKLPKTGAGTPEVAVAIRQGVRVDSPIYWGDDEEKERVRSLLRHWAEERGVDVLLFMQAAQILRRGGLEEVSHASAHDSRPVRQARRPAASGGSSRRRRGASSPGSEPASPTGEGS